MGQSDRPGLPYRPCVGIVVTDGAGRVFSGQRIDTKGDAWQMPQGGIDAGETPEAAAYRELGEETGIPASAVELVDRTPDWLTYDLPPDLAPLVWGGKYRGQRQLWFLMRFAGPDTLIDIDRRHAEFQAWAWMHPDELVARIVPFKRETYEAVFDAFARHFR